MPQWENTSRLVWEDKVNSKSLDQVVLNVTNEMGAQRWEPWWMEGMHREPAGMPWVHGKLIWFKRKITDPFEDTVSDEIPDFLTQK